MIWNAPIHIVLLLPHLGPQIATRQQKNNKKYYCYNIIVTCILYTQHSPENIILIK